MQTCATHMGLGLGLPLVPAPPWFLCLYVFTCPLLVSLRILLALVRYRSSPPGGVPFRYESLGASAAPSTSLSLLCACDPIPFVTSVAAGFHALAPSLHLSMQWQATARGTWRRHMGLQLLRPFRHRAYIPRFHPNRFPFQRETVLCGTTRVRVAASRSSQRATPGCHHGKRRLMGGYLEEGKSLPIVLALLVNGHDTGPENSPRGVLVWHQT